MRWLGYFLWISWHNFACGETDAYEVLAQAELEYLDASHEATLAEKRLSDNVRIFQQLEDHQNTSAKNVDKFAILETDEEKDWALQMRDLSSVLETEMEVDSRSQSSPADACDELAANQSIKQDNALPEAILKKLAACAALIHGYYDHLYASASANREANSAYVNEFLKVWHALQELKSDELQNKFKEEHKKVVESLLKMTNILHSKSMGDLYNADLRPWSQVDSFDKHKGIVASGVHHIVQKEGE